MRPGDYAYFLAAPERVTELDGLFASTEAAGARPALGEFPLRGDAALATLAELYGLEVALEDQTRTVADVFASRFENEPAVGDVASFGPATLIVRGVDDGRVARAVLRLEDEGDDAPIQGFSDGGAAQRAGVRIAEWVAALRKRLGFA